MNRNVALVIVKLATTILQEWSYCFLKKHRSSFNVNKFSRQIKAIKETDKSSRLTSTPPRSPPVPTVSSKFYEISDLSAVSSAEKIL